MIINDEYYLYSNPITKSDRHGKATDDTESGAEQEGASELRGGKECVGTLDGYDQYMNLILKSAEEKKDGEVFRKSELILLRGDNIVFISP